MNSNLFDINSFNVIEDKDNYYFFRALNNGDYSDINNGITFKDNKLIEIRTDLDRYTNIPLYHMEDKITLDEVHDHVRWAHRYDTKCISLSTNANVVALYGRESYHNQYIMYKVPKNKLKENNIYISGLYLLEEINKKINDINLDDDKKEYIKRIRNCKNNEEIFNILNEYGILNENKYYDYLTLNNEQNLEKNKIIAMLDIIDKRIYHKYDNRLLVESIKLSFNSSELIHYGNIKNNFKMISPITIDLLSIIQQSKGKVDNISLNKVKDKVLECIEIENSFNNDLYNKYKSKINNYDIDDDIEVSDIYKLTYGNIPYDKAKKALDFTTSLCKSKVKTYELCNLLKEIVDDKSLNSTIDEIYSNSYIIDPLFISRNYYDEEVLSDSICISLNSKDKHLFSNNEQIKIIDYVNSLSLEKKKEFILNKGLDNEKLLCNLLTPANEERTLNDYYANTIISYLDLDGIYNDSKITRLLTNSEKELLYNNLKKANCINMFNSLKELDFSYEEISSIVFNLMLNDKYNGLNFIDLSNQDNFKELMKKNIANLNTKVSAYKLDYLLGIKDNNYKIPNSNIILRDYQQLAVNNVDKIFENHNYAGVVLPTGAGKSFVAITEMLKHSDQNIIYYAPNNEILRQLQKHILKHVLNIDVISDDLEDYYLSNQKQKPSNMIFSFEIDDIIQSKFPYFNMYCYQGLTTKEDEFFESRNAGLIILDEVHRTGAEEWNKKIKILIKNNPDAKILGVTATPIRDVDQVNMVKKLAEITDSYTKEQILRKEYLAAEMYLVDAMQDGIVVSPNIITFDYTLEDSDRYKEVKKMYEEEKDLKKKEELKKTYDDMRKIVENSKKKGMANIIKEGFINNQKPLDGKYIVFLPMNPDGTIQTETYINNQIEIIKDYFKEIDPNPNIEYLLSSRKDKKANSLAINNFEKNNGHLSLIFAINMLNEGVHVDNIDGVVMLRPLGAGNKILYYQQIGRCIYALDPNHELEISELPVIFDVYNNYLEQNMDREINRHTTTSDLQKLLEVKDWIERHYRFPDINSIVIEEARKAITLKRIQTKYRKYLDKEINIDNEENYEIKRIIEIGNELSIWNINFGERIIPPTEREIQQSLAFKLHGEQKNFVELFNNALKINNLPVKSSKELRLLDILNLLDILSEYGFEINYKNLKHNMKLEDIYNTLSEDIVVIIKNEINLDLKYPIYEEYEFATYEFKNKNKLYNDYDFKTLKKMGIFEHLTYESEYITKSNGKQVKNRLGSIVEKDFIVRGPAKFQRLNIKTGTYFDENGFDIDGYDKELFKDGDSLVNKYGFDREGYYYETTNDGTLINTGFLYNPYGFDIKGDYYELQRDGTYLKVGKLNKDHFDKDGIYHMLDSITKKYTKTKKATNEYGFNIDGYYCTSGRKIGKRAKEIVFYDGKVYRVEDIVYLSELANVTKGKIFCTYLPFNYYYFDKDGYYYEEIGNNKRQKTDRLYNDDYFDIDGYYYELDDNNNRVKTDRKYNDNYFGMDGYYYKLDSEGNRVKTNSRKDENGFNQYGLKIYKNIYFYRGAIAYDKDGYYYELDEKDYVFRKIIPAIKVSRYGFDKDGYYYEEKNGVLTKTDKMINKYGFSIEGYYYINEKDYTFLDNRGFDIEGKYHKKVKENIQKSDVITHVYPNIDNAHILNNPIRSRHKKDEIQKEKLDEKGFDQDKMYVSIKDGKITRNPYNNIFFDIDGYYYQKVKLKDGTYTRVKTNFKLNPRCFDAEGHHYKKEIYKDKDGKEKTRYVRDGFLDEHYFDVEGYYYDNDSLISKFNRKKENHQYESPNISIYDARTGNYEIYNYYHDRIKTRYKVNKEGFDCYGYYRGCDGKDPRTTKYNNNGFDIDGYFKEPDKNGKKRKYDNNGNDKYGKLINIEINNTLDYVDFINFINEDEEVETDPNINRYGFDKDGYYHEKLSDGTRKKESTTMVSERGFKANGINEITNSIEDIYGFDIDGLVNDKYRNERVNLMGFDVHGNYYDRKKHPTGNKYNEKGFDLYGNYWEEKDGTRLNTYQPFNEEGYDSHGFDKEGIHKETKLKYNKKYFRQDGINVITNTYYSITGETINGIVNNSKMHRFLKFPTKSSEYSYIQIANLFLDGNCYDLTKYTNMIKEQEPNRDKRKQYIYDCVVVSAVTNSEVKQKLIKYIKKLNEQIIYLTTIIESKDKDKQKDEIKELKKELTQCKTLFKNINLGGIENA